MVISVVAVTLWAVSLAGLFAAAVTDFKHRIIPNRLVALTAGCGVALRLLLEPRSIGLNIVVAATVLLVLGVLAHRELIGGGDAKLIAAATLLVPPGQIAALLLSIAVGGGLLSGIYLLAHLMLRGHDFVDVDGNREPCSPLPREGLLRVEVARIAARESIPYGLAIFGGTASLAVVEALRWFSATS